MQLKDLAIVALMSAVLPWLAVHVVVLLSTYSPLFLGLVEPNSSETTIALAAHAQGLVEALVVSVPVSALLAWTTKSSPFLLAAAIVTGYSIAFFAWGFSASASAADLAKSYIVPNHLLLVLVLGLSVFVFRRLSSGSAKRTSP